MFGLIECTVAKVKRLALRNGGDNCIRGLSRALGIAEDCGSANMPIDAFVAALSNYGVSLSEYDIQALTKYFDRHGIGKVSPQEFMTSLRSGLSAKRRSAVQRAFRMFNKDVRGSISLDEMRARFCPSLHPAVTRGELSEKEVLRRFEESFDYTTNPAGTISKQEFEEYYSGVSAGIELDDEFVAVVFGCWKLPFYESYIIHGVHARDPAFSMQQQLEEQEVLIGELQINDAFASATKKHREILLESNEGFRGVGRVLRKADTTGSGYVSEEIFLDVLKRNRLYFDDPRLVSRLDTAMNETIDYMFYMCLVVGELPPARQLLLEQLWRGFPTDKHDMTEVSNIHKRYHAPNGEALSSFLDAWDKRVLGATGLVSFQEFVEWLLPISNRIRSDTQFEEHLHDEWSL